MPSLAALAIAIALAAPGPRGIPREHATLCLDPVGENLGATCRSYGASLIDRAPDICQCLNAGARVVAPYCAPGERPLPDSAAVRRARREAAAADGSLFGKRFQGRSFCQPRP